jgi:uncharacterized zinc-type alcohol dehydrogenase-like protein
MVDSDRTCHHCREGLEQFCPNLTLTYNSPDIDLAGAAPQRHTLPCATGELATARKCVVGLGGLGHMGVKFAHMRSEPTSSSSPPPMAAALGLSADEVVVSRNADEMKKHTGSFDFILDTVSADHDINAYLNLLA